MKSSKEIRQNFLDFFKNKEHQILKSASVIPQDDPTLLFTNAGMNQFKKIFLGQEQPVNLRVADSQKCIRVSGKHNDLEEVGKDTYHHTFFEMLGNWSFGDYYKKSAIQYAWELFTEVWKFPKERLWATVYKDDDEAAELWAKYTDINPSQILGFAEKDNFWEMGDVGPCGPCSEIHYYIGDDPKNQEAAKVNADDPEYIELWNLVFIQYNRDKNGKLNPLPVKHVDTGAGLERIVAALQGKTSNYDTDLFSPIIQKIANLSNIKYTEKDGVPHRVISDHIRMLTFSIADGGMPSNEGRGYVIRRILRRASRFGRMLEMHKPFIYKLVDTVIEIFGNIYPEIIERREHIQKVIKNEEQSFSETLDRGLEVFHKIYDEVKSAGKKYIPGTDAFKLYDTYGFPFDLTCLIAEEKGLSVDEAGFNTEMTKQKERARTNVNFEMDYDENSVKWIKMTDGADSGFIGYFKNECQANIRKYFIDKNRISLVLDQTVFYAESGGEVGDTGKIVGQDFQILVENTVKSNNSIIHMGKIVKGEIGKNPAVTASIDHGADISIRANHTSTHLLHSALKQTLGDHVNQAGSLVMADRLRFDLTHYEKIKREQLDKLEDIINAKIFENVKLDINVMAYDEAKKSGAMALFGEKYGDEVRVVKIGDFSMELCGGKHVRRTGDIGYFKIVSESSVASGIRRIEAVTGKTAIEESRKNEHIIEQLESLTRTSKDELVKRVEKFYTEIKDLEKSLNKQNAQNWEEDIKRKIQQAETIDGMKIITHQVDSQNMDELKKIGDIIRNNVKDGIGAIASSLNNKPKFVVVVTDETIKKRNLNAGEIIKPLGKILGGGGGGRPHLATSGGTMTNKIPEVFIKLREIIEEKLQNTKN